MNKMNVMKIRLMVAALGFVGGLPLISTNLFAQEVADPCAGRTPRALQSRGLLITTCGFAGRPPSIRRQRGRANQLQL